MASATPFLYRHTRRPDWGLAVLAAEGDGKRTFLFADGGTRVLAENFCALMAPADPSGAEDLALVERLLKQVGRMTERGNSPRSAEASIPLSVEDQISLFQLSYPKGFADPAWQKKMRGPGASPLKRHRVPALNEAKDVLKAEAFKAQGDEAVARLWVDFVLLLSKTDLVPPAQIKQLEKARIEIETVQSLGELLHGSGTVTERFDAFVHLLQKALGKQPAWEMLTASLSLVHPDRYICVRRTNFEHQSAWMHFELGSVARPSGMGYAKLCEMAVVLRDKLAAHGLAPGDMLDVHDFVRLTTSPVSQKSMRVKRRSAGSPVSSREGTAQAAA